MSNSLVGRLCKLQIKQSSSAADDRAEQWDILGSEWQSFHRQTHYFKLLGLAGVFSLDFI